MSAGIIAVGMLGAASANAATRYAKPTGPFGPEPCEASAPCSLGNAIQSAQVHDGDTVLLLPGNYGVPDGNAPVPIGHDITVGAAGPDRPTISNSGNGVFVVQNGGATLQDLNIVASNLPSGLGDMGAWAVDLQNGSDGERLYVAASGLSNPMAVFAHEGATLRDSVAWGSGSGAVGVITGGSGGMLRNVTASGDGDGVFVNESFGPNQTTTLRNVIALGANDVRITDGGSGTTALVADHSNNDPPTTTGTPTVTETNPQRDEPSLQNAVAGDFHEVDGSPTIDAGSSDLLDPALGTQDLDGNPRSTGTAPDIGAYEFVPPQPPQPQPGEPETGGDTTPPDTQITAKPKPKTHKKTAGFGFSSTEPGSTFECRLDDGAFAACASPKAFKVKKGKHSFEVRARDAAGNVDPTPAVATWKVKHKHE